MTTDTHVEDIPLPGMPEPEPLWAIRCGDGELLAMPSKRVAELHKELCDELDLKLRERGSARRHDAVLVRWPGTSVEHADALVQQEADA